MGCKPSQPTAAVDSDESSLDLDNKKDNDNNNKKNKTKPNSSPKAAPEVAEREPASYATKKVPDRKMDPYEGAPPGSDRRLNASNSSLDHSSNNGKKSAAPEVAERKPQPYATRELSDSKLNVNGKDSNKNKKPDNGSNNNKSSKNSSKERSAPPPAAKQPKSSSSSKSNKKSAPPKRQDSSSSSSSSSSDSSDEDEKYVPPPSKKEKAAAAKQKSAPSSKAPLQPGQASYDPYEDADPAKWRTKQLIFSGSFTYATKGYSQDCQGSIKKGIGKFKANPKKYVCLFHQTNMTGWPTDQQRYVMVHREDTSGYNPTGVGKGPMTLYMHTYERLPSYPNDELPNKSKDKYTDSMTHQGRKLHSGSNLPIMPGRGMGVCDTPSLKLIGDIDPSDIKQGTVGDCWLLSGISSLAEFDGAVKRLFRKTKQLDNRPLDGPNMYTVTLWDLETWTERDIEIDERLPVMADGSRKLLGSHPSDDGELWACYLEKALAVHCGGWDKITGGQCTHAWSLLTGCKEQYTIRRNPKSKKFQCFGKYDPNKKQWMRHGNSPHDGDKVTWPMAWPQVGGGEDMMVEMSEEQLFQKMCAWDASNYIIGAGCQSKAGDKGLVDNHAYSVIECHNNVAGTDIDLIKVRNPWGSGEVEDGMFDDDGPGWNRYPQIKKLLNPVVADDGIFWVTKQEFFKFFATVYLSASDMTRFLED